jgi:uncharacterized membrane protein
MSEHDVMYTKYVICIIIIIKFIYILYLFTFQLNNPLANCKVRMIQRRQNNRRTGKIKLTNKQTKNKTGLYIYIYIY